MFDWVTGKCEARHGILLPRTVDMDYVLVLTCLPQERSANENERLVW